MNIPVHLLQTLASFYDSKSLVETAKKLQTTQPTVTRQLQQLQGFFEQELFYTQGRRKVLTPFAEAIVVSVKHRFINLENDIQNISHDFNERLTVKVRISGRFEILKKHFALSDFDKKLELVAMSGEQTQAAIINGDTDMAISGVQILTSDYICKKFFTDYFCVVVPKKFLKSNESIEDWLSRADQYPFCAYKANYNKLKMMLKNVKHKSSFNEKEWSGLVDKIQDRFIFSDWEALEQRVHMGYNWSIIPSSYINEGRNYLYLKIDSHDHQQFFLYYRKSLSRQAWFKNYIENYISHKSNG